MAIRVKTIQNVSQQAVSIIHQEGDVAAAGSIPASSTGSLRIMPGSSTTIEESRIDLGQLQNLQSRNLIKMVDGLIHTESVDDTSDCECSVFDFMTAEQIADVCAGTGDIDVTLAVRNAFEYANDRYRVGLGPYIRHSACTLVIPAGSYNLESIAEALPIECNVRNEGAAFLVPATYLGTVVRVGPAGTPDLLATASIQLPDIYKPVGTALYTGTAVLVANLNACRVYFGRIDYFDYAMHFGGIGQGTVYCEFFLGQTSYVNRMINIENGTDGWCNTNNFYSGNFRHGGHRVSGKYHVYMLGGDTAIVGNNFIGVSFEGDGAEYVVYAKNAYGNHFTGCYLETGNAGQDVTVLGDTLTDVDHGLVVGDMVAFAATLLPTGMYDATPYYVVTVPTDDTFEVSSNKGGTAITFSSTGTDVRYFLQPRSYFDGTGSSTWGNRFNDSFVLPSVYMDYIQVGPAGNNGEDTYYHRQVRVGAPNDYPVFRAGNASLGAATRAVFAAYPPTVDSSIEPLLWTTAISDRGLMFQTDGVENGRVTCNYGILYFESGNSGTLLELPSHQRSASYTTLPSTVVAAGTRSLVTFTLNNAAVGDYVVPMTASALPDGILIAWSRVSAADTVMICFYNWSGAPIDLIGAQLKATVIKSAI